MKVPSFKGRGESGPMLKFMLGLTASKISFALTFALFLNKAASVLLGAMSIFPENQGVY